MSGHFQPKRPGTFAEIRSKGSEPGVAQPAVVSGTLDLQQPHADALSQCAEYAKFLRPLPMRKSYVSLTVASVHSASVPGILFAATARVSDVQAGPGSRR
jgi:hypothetical protein